MEAGVGIRAGQTTTSRWFPRGRRRLPRIAPTTATIPSRKAIEWKVVLDGRAELSQSVHLPDPSRPIPDISPPTTHPDPLIAGFQEASARPTPIPEWSEARTRALPGLCRP